jgi:hypothetical protein
MVLRCLLARQKRARGMVVMRRSSGIEQAARTLA